MKLPLKFSITPADWMMVLDEGLHVESMQIEELHGITIPGDVAKKALSVRTSRERRLALKGLVDPEIESFDNP